LGFRSSPSLSGFLELVSIMAGFSCYCGGLVTGPKLITNDQCLRSTSTFLQELMNLSVWCYGSMLKVLEHMIVADIENTPQFFLSLVLYFHQGCVCSFSCLVIGCCFIVRSTCIRLLLCIL
jgi:hypothetical protein